MLPRCSSVRGTPTVRIFGPCRSWMSSTCPPIASDTRRTRSARTRCSSCVPCEKLSLAKLIPARIIARRMSSESDAGPRVQTIFVRLVGVVRFNAYSLCLSTHPNVVGSQEWQPHSYGPTRCTFLASECKRKPVHPSPTISPR